MDTRRSKYAPLNNIKSIKIDKLLLAIKYTFESNKSENIPGRSKQLSLQAIEHYQNAMQDIPDPKSLTDDQNRLIARIYRDWSMECFNYTSTADAMELNLKAFNHLNNLRHPNDTDRRMIIRICLYLTDDYYLAGMQNEAQNALKHACEIFSRINNKYADEEQLQNQKSLYDYYMKKGTSSSYLTSTELQNRRHLLMEADETRRSVEQLEAQITDLCVAKPSPEQTLEKQMRTLSVQPSNDWQTQPWQVANQSLFSCQKNSDKEIRLLARKYIELGNGYMKDSKDVEALSTYMQASETLHKIANKKEEDNNLIQAIQNEVNKLQSSLAAKTNTPSITLFSITQNNSMQNDAYNNLHNSDDTHENNHQSNNFDSDYGYDSDRMDIS